MEPLPYIPGLKAAEPGPLSRFLPPLEEGTISTWLSRHFPSSTSPGWLLDPFGFSPRLAVEAARAGYRVLVTVNNPITRFLLEMAARLPVSNEIDLPMSRQDIADYLGLTIETVSRTLTQLENTAAIAVPTSRRIVLRNRAALNRLNA